MNLIRLSLLALVFLTSMLIQPNWVYENFWSKADFYDSVPFDVPFMVFLLIYSIIATAVAELSIRFVKKYA
jgi:hypothetical protein